MILLLVSHHSNVCGGSCDTLWLSIPYDWVGGVHSSLLNLLMRLSITYLLLLTKDVRSLACKSSQVLGDIVCPRIRFICFSLVALCFLFFPLGVHYADFEMFPPLALIDYLLAVGTLLSTLRLLYFFSCSIICFSDIIFDHFHLWVKGRSLW